MFKLKKINLFFLIFLVIFLIGCRSNKLFVNPDFLSYNSSELYPFKIFQIYPTDNLNPPIGYTESHAFRFVPITDSSFVWSNRISFNKVQKGLRWVKVPAVYKSWIATYSQPSFDTIGVLKNGEWYLLTGLSKYGYDYYVFIDKNGNTKVYEVNKLNY